MKTINYLTTMVALLLLSAGVANAQLAFGAKLGLNSSTQAQLGQLYNSDYLVGSQVGASVDYRFHPILSIQAEAIYITKGGTHSLDGLYDHQEVSRKFEYLNVPLLVKASFGPELGLNEKHRVFLYSGPYAGKLLSATDYVDSKSISEVSDIENDALDFDSGISFGGGYTHILKSRHEVFFDVRYDMGLAEVVSSDDRLRNKTIAFSIGYNFF